MSAWNSPTGGIQYHYRAMRYRKTLWNEYVTELEKWLKRWNPPESQLILVGPSAGWTLPSSFLMRFSRIEALDPDPVAAFLFSWRFRSLRRQCDFQWNSRDYLSPSALVGARETFRDFLEARPSCAVLFCNVLGQLRLLDSQGINDRVLRRFLVQLPETLGRRSWASYHDRCSGFVAPELPVSGVSSELLSNSELLDKYYGGATGTSRNNKLEDHKTDGLFGDTPREYLRWELFPGYYHLVELAAYRLPTPALSSSTVQS